MAPRRNSRSRCRPTGGSTRHGEGSRIFTITPGFQLVALDALSGSCRCRASSKGGIVDLKDGLPRVADLPKTPPGSSSPPVIVGDVVVAGVSFSAGGAPSSKAAVPGWIRGYDARTGATAVGLPHRSTAGRVRVFETWEDDSASYTGNTPRCGHPSPPMRRAVLVYLPVEATDRGLLRRPPPRQQFVFRRPGMHRCQDRQAPLALPDRAPRYLGDYDLAGRSRCWSISPLKGRKIPAVVQVTKMGLIFVFDRHVTGKPVWPIEERPVPQTDVPGEQTAATQPYPTRPGTLRATGPAARRPHRLHARPEAPGAGDRQGLPLWTGLPAALGGRRRRQSGHRCCDRAFRAARTGKARRWIRKRASFMSARFHRCAPSACTQIPRSRMSAYVGVYGEGLPRTGRWGVRTACH